MFREIIVALAVSLVYAILLFSSGCRAPDPKVISDTTTAIGWIAERVQTYQSTPVTIEEVAADLRHSLRWLEQTGHINTQDKAIYQALLLIAENPKAIEYLITQVKSIDTISANDALSLIRHVADITK